MKWGVPKPLQRTARSARELFDWWCVELREAANLLLRKLPSRQSPQVFVRVDAASMLLELHQAGEWKAVGTVPAGSDGAWPRGIPGLPEELAGARTAILLPESELFFCDFDLPSAAERQLAAVVRLQLERTLPVAMERVVYDQQILARDRELLKVRVAVAHRERVEFLRELIASWGLTPVAAGTVSDAGVSAYNFLKRRRDRPRWRPTSRDTRLMRAAAAGLGLLMLVVGAQWLRERSVVESVASELQARAAQIAREREQVLRDARPLVALQSIASTRDAPAVLAALSAAVPQGAWFNHVEISTDSEKSGAGKSGRLRLMGTLAARDETLAALRAVPGVRDLEVASTFDGRIGSAETVEIVADFGAVPSQGSAP